MITLRVLSHESVMVKREFSSSEKRLQRFLFLEGIMSDISDREKWTNAYYRVNQRAKGLSLRCVSSGNVNTSGFHALCSIFRARTAVSSNV